MQWVKMTPEMMAENRVLKRQEMVRNRGFLVS